MASSALLSETFWLAPVSEMAYWNQKSVPEGRPAGHRKGSFSVPLACVTSGRLATVGNATSTPPLNGVGVEDNETSSAQALEAFACVSARLPIDPLASVPVPASAGVPLLPALAWPRSVQVGRPPAGCGSSVAPKT